MSANRSIGEAAVVEAARLQLLEDLAVLDTPPEAAFDEIVKFAATLFSVPIAAISLVDEHRQWFKASVGLDVPETARRHAFCHHVVATGDDMVVPDATRDERFAANPLVVGEPSIRFYAGTPLRAAGYVLGTLCIIDRTPRHLSASDLDKLRFLGSYAQHMLELRARRNFETPPSSAEVCRLARRIAAGDPTDMVLDGVGRPAWIYDAESLRIIAVNRHAIDHYGWSADEWTSRTILDIRPPADRSILAAVIENASFVGDYSGGRLWRHQRADGQIIDVQVTGADLTVRGRPHRLVVATDVTAAVALHGALNRAANIDAITGMANRPHFFRTVDRLLIDGCDDLSLLFVDLDRFKLVNDTRGHHTGDALLAAAAARITSVVSTDDAIARIGGDEFAIAHLRTDDTSAARLAAAVRSAIGQPFRLDGSTHVITASIGTTHARPGVSAATLLAEADAAMYAAKESGRNSMVEFDQVLRDRMAVWEATQRDLHAAFEHDEIEVDFQPIEDLAGGPRRYEALARWRHPTRGRLTPDAFIQIAEESGQIVRLGQIVLDLACSAATRRDIQVSVNVSANQLGPALVDTVATLIGHHRLDPGQLVIEVTESAVADEQLAHDTLTGLRDAGAQIWIDDFGTGYSSLARLSTLPVDALKLDRQFVAELHTPHGWGIARAVAGIGQALSIDVVAEGVETNEQLELVQQLGCRFAQGFLLGRPTPLDDDQPPSVDGGSPRRMQNAPLAPDNSAEDRRSV